MGKTSYFLCIGEAAQFLGVCTKTLRRWDKIGYFKPNYRTRGTHRRYSIDILKVYSNTKEFKTHENKTSQLRCAVYARVSAPKQKGDFARQIESVKDIVKNSELIPVKVYTDIASGVNDKRKGLKKLLDDVPKRLFDN